MISGRERQASRAARVNPGNQSSEAFTNNSQPEEADEISHVKKTKKLLKLVQDVTVCEREALT